MINMKYLKYLILIVLVLSAFLFIFTACGDPVEPDEHMGPDDEEEEEMDENSEDDGYGMLNEIKIEALLL